MIALFHLFIFIASTLCVCFAFYRIGVRVGRKQMKCWREARIKRMESSGDAMYELIKPSSPIFRTSEMGNLLQGWDDAKQAKEDNI